MSEWRRECSTTWLREIQAGRKKYLAMPRSSESEIKLGDTIVLHDGSVELRVVVCSSFEFPDFVITYEFLKHDLYPGLFPPEVQVAERYYYGSYGRHADPTCLVLKIE